MSKKPDYAFPACNDGGVHEWGMTLRDYFAGQFAIGFWSNQLWVQSADEAAVRQDVRLSQMFAAKAYEYADAMLKERAK